MSSALDDEVEAINSIYGDGTLVRADDGQEAIFILHLPDFSSDEAAAAGPSTSSSSLRLQFPAAYPDEPPAVLGTHSSGENPRRRGAAVQDLELFRTALGDVYEVGQVCLFDALEKLKELVQAESQGARLGRDIEDDQKVRHEEVESSAEAGKRGQGAGPLRRTPAPTPPLDHPPPWTLSDPVTELKSTFLARCAPVHSPAEAAAYVDHLVTTDRHARAATHNMTAWRIRGGPPDAATATAYQDCDDDGETAAGGRLLHLLQLMDIWDVVVVVSRWYGGHKLGPRRFALINAVARDALVKAGFVAEHPLSGSAAKKKTSSGR
ncbi:hypothetical protein VTK73DRAFT_3469 [Phialemonium thermophilum]|uniref:RWD domain-containing protein n=1 Tax=Phialemonium thermophilum TaxID=223376 RepID=A0ABR3WZ07_9PEZI